MDEMPTDKVYMWMVFLTTIAFIAIIVFAYLVIQDYQQGYTVQPNPFAG